MLDLDDDGLAALSAKIQSDPEWFLREVLDRQPYADQVPIIKSVAKSRYTAVKSGHSCGKDWLAGGLGLWFHSAFYPSKVIITGPTDRQVKQIVWAEFKSACRSSKIPVGGELLPDSAHLKSGDPNHFVLGFTGKDPDSFQGFHADNVMVIVTEATGVSPHMWPAIHSLMTANKNARMLVIGNALYDPESEFYSFFTSKADLWDNHTLDSERSPFCSKLWVDEQRRVHGEGSPYYLARVKGIFPTDVADTLIPLGWIERAHTRFWEKGIHLGEKSLGVDVARFGSDETVFVLGRGNRFEVVHVARGNDLMATVGHVQEAIRKWGLAPAQVRVDDTGVGGGVTDRLKELGVKVTAVNFGAAPSDAEKFTDVKTEMFWTLRERFREGTMAIDPKDVKMLRDLSILKTKMTSKGHKLISKQEMKEKLGYSPDRGDAIALAALPQQQAENISHGKKSNMGMLSYYKTLAVSKTGKEEAVAKSPVSSSPQAAALLEASREQVKPRYDEGRIPR